MQNKNLCLLVKKYSDLARKIERYFGVIGDPIEILALNEADKYLNLKFNTTHNIPGYDALDDKWQKVEIKGIRTKDESYGYIPGPFNGLKKKIGKFNYAILVSFNYKSDVKFVLKMSSKLIKRYITKRGALTISKKLIRKEINNSNFRFLYLAKDIDLYDLLRDMRNDKM